jgi:pimeloyl-ACP methyl ester carboxylesterase
MKMGEHVRAGTLDMWVERQGTGPDVLLIAGLGDPAEVWQFQLDGLADRYRLTAYDNRGMGRTPLPAEPFSVAAMADDAAALLRALDVPAAHVAGFSGGSAIAQELALRHPGLVRSLVLTSTWARSDAFLRAAVKFWRWLPEAAPTERAFLEAFYLWIYTPRAHEDGTVDKIIEEVLAFPHQPSVEAIQRSIDAFLGHDTADRLSQIAVPTLVVAGGLDRITPPSYGRAVADAIPGAQFEVLAEEAHQPFQEVPDLFNATVDTFWHQVEARGGAALRPPALPPARRAGVMSGSASAPTRVPAAGQGKNVRWVSLPRWALAHGCPVAGSRSTGNASRTDAA